MSIPVRSGRPAIGTTVIVPNVGACTVVSNADPSLVTVATSGGAIVRVGERALSEDYG